ncbi:DUF4224 domain-containing protein [Glaciimonas sp. PAMC28666]|uniref:DUF4224 domain-containing protein n=1 Tax=Glaciimonas sp. PAMC28666 TaxID=2807626 RepID=UPI0019655F97|nr:DUF4224 domain-containing protein [Glaciimonas sp. PAMC28666]QRX80816.1 DUF4224 domain-containing protein [Glaciimonas sp. PAMC28666]
MFLSESEITTLTGRKMKGHQVRALQQMGLPFFVNAVGRPVIARSTIEGGKQEPVKRGWVPSVLRAK